MQDELRQLVKRHAEEQADAEDAMAEQKAASDAVVAQKEVRPRPTCQMHMISLESFCPDSFPML